MCNDDIKTMQYMWVYYLYVQIKVTMTGLKEDVDYEQKKMVELLTDIKQLMDVLSPESTPDKILLQKEKISTIAVKSKETLLFKSLREKDNELTMFESYSFRESDPLERLDLIFRHMIERVQNVSKKGAPYVMGCFMLGFVWMDNHIKESGL